MNARTVSTISLIVALLQAGVGRAVDPPATAPMPTPLATPAADPAYPADVHDAPLMDHGHGLSPWVLYSHDDCCGPIGKNGPVWMEVFARFGPSQPVSGGMFHNRLDTGWMIDVGGRSLFFDQPEIRAWTIDLSVSNHYNARNPGSAPFVGVDRATGLLVPLRVIFLNRTYVNFSAGREYYLIGSASSPDGCLRVGWNGGVRWGTARMDVDDPIRPPSFFERLNSLTWGPFVAVHSDIEIPIGCAFFVTGVRLEFQETFNHRLSPNSINEINDINALVTLGLRY